MKRLLFLTLCIFNATGFADEVEHFVIVGSFGSETAAQSMLAKTAENHATRVIRTAVGDQIRYRAGIGPIDEYSDAVALQEILKRSGHVAAWLLYIAKPVQATYAVPTDAHEAGNSTAANATTAPIVPRQTQTDASLIE